VPDILNQLLLFPVIALAIAGDIYYSQEQNDQCFKAANE